MRVRIGAAAILAGIGLLLVAGRADAHAVLRSSDPAAGTQLDASPDSVTIVFTEEPEPTLTIIHVLDTSGGPWEKGKPQRIAGQPKALRVAVKKLPDGTYTVAWRAVSRVDGHATAGAFAFGVGVPARTVASAGKNAPPPSPPPSGLEMAGRWTLFLGIAGLIGSAWVGAAGFGGTPAGSLGRLAAGSWFAAIAGIGLLAAAQTRASGVGVGDLLKTSLGHALLWRAAGVAVAGIGLIVVARATGGLRRIARWGTAAAAAGAMLAHVAAGHAAAQSSAAAEIAAQWVHVIAAAVWIGGLAALLVGIRGVPAPEKTVAVRRFSTVAGVALAAVVGTGVVRAFGQIDSWNALFETGYGRLILVKAALILPLASLGGINRYRNVPKADTTLGGLRRVSRSELGIAAGLFAVAAVLASVAPPAPGRAEAAPAGIVVNGSDFGTTVRVRLTVTPGTAGPNDFVARITDFDTGKPAPAERVSLRFSFIDDSAVGKSILPLERGRNGEWRAKGTNLSLGGRWRVALVIERGAGSVEIPLTVATPCTTTAQAVPGQPTIYTMDIPGVGTAQGYLDPGRAGVNNEVHITFFDPAGNELPISGPVTMRAARGEDVRTFEVRRFGPGHFVADAELEAATWRIDFAATNVGGRTLRGCFSDTVR